MAIDFLMVKCTLLLREILFTWNEMLGINTAALQNILYSALNNHDCIIIKSE